MTREKTLRKMSFLCRARNSSMLFLRSPRQCHCKLRWEAGFRLSQEEIVSSGFGLFSDLNFLHFSGERKAQGNNKTLKIHPLLRIWLITEKSDHQYSCFPQ